MKFMTDRMGSGRINRKKLTKAEAEALAAFDEFQKYREDKCYPYAIIGGNAVLYVSPYKMIGKPSVSALIRKATV